jgi:hypothetical protein
MWRFSKKLILMMAIIVIFFPNNNCRGDDSTFRKTKWGMSIQEVKQSEPMEPNESKENILVYKTNIINKNVFLVYFFVDNKLVRARYTLAEEHSNKNDFIHDYDEFKEIIKKKYGKPVKDDILWKSRIYKNDPSNYGMAVATGNLSYFSSWKTNNSKIICFLHGDNFNVFCGVEYVSNELGSIEKEHEEKKNLEKF